MSVRRDLRVPPAWDGRAATRRAWTKASRAALAGDATLWAAPFAPPSEADRHRVLGDAYGDLALVIPTSGTTGAPKAVAHGAGSLAASAERTAEVLGGAGPWLAAVPPTHIAGQQTVLRSLLAGTEPMPIDFTASFGPRVFRAAAEELFGALPAGSPAHVSLVPTQLRRLLADPGATALLARFTSLLVGGAFVPRELLAACREAGIRAVTSYGSSETAGGCVYDGVPLRDVVLRTDGSPGRLEICSPTLAVGYLGPDGPLADQPFRTEADGRRWFMTSDLAEVGDDGRLTLLGRADDVIVTGGEKVAPVRVEQVLQAVPGVAEALVVGVLDPEWGERVVALLVPSAAPDGLAGGDDLSAADGPDNPAGVDGLAAACAAACRDALPRWAVPKQFLRVDALPTLGIGKADRRAASLLAAERAARHLRP